jgi:hypothetical protein
MNEQPSPQIVVDPSAMPEIVGVAFRYAAALLAGWLIRRGYMTDSDEPLIVGIVMAVVAAGYAAWKAHKNKAKLVTVARSADNSVAIVKGDATPTA